MQGVGKSQAWMNRKGRNFRGLQILLLFVVHILDILRGWSCIGNLRDASFWVYSRCCNRTFF